MKKSKKILSVLLAVLMFMSIVPVSDMGIEASAANFTPRLTAPERTGYYSNNTSTNPYSVNNNAARGNCTWYAWGRAYEILGSRPKINTIGNACTWYPNNKSSGNYPYGSEPKLGAIVCWSGGSSGAGHVAIVEQIHSDGTITISESSWSATTWWFRTKTINKNGYYSSTLSFQGYIYIGNYDYSYKIGQYKTTASSGLILRGSASTSGSYLDLIPNGTTVNVTSISGNWGYTKYNGQNGWICLDYATYINHTHSYTSKVTTSPTCYSTGVKTYTCSCGSSYTESISKTSHDYTGKKYKEPDHPHEVLQTCVNYSKCGAYYYNGEYATSNSCSQCWKVEWSLSQSSVSVRVGESKSIDCVITSVLPDTQTSRAEWDEDLFDVAITKNLITVTGKKAGSGSIRMYFWSDSSKSTLISSKTIPVTVTSDKITINYNANGGTGAPSSQTKSYGQSIDLSTTIPTRFGYNFLGWVTDKSHTSADYEPGTSFSLNNDTTLYALWQSADMFLSSSNKTANIKYAGTMCYFQYTAMATSDFVIYSTGSSDTKVYLYDANGNLLASDDDSGESNNFRLKYNLTYGNKYYYGIKFYNSSLKGNINVTFGRVYNIAYNGNATDATGVPSSQEKVRDISLTLSSTKPSRNGYTFLGWSTSSSATTATYQPGETYTNNSSLTLYAVWSKNHTHSYTSKITTAPTCAKTGVRTYTCACGTSYTETVSIDSTNHAYSTQIKNKQAATCKTQGYTGDTYCTGCSAKLKTGSVIAKTSHSYGSWITTTEATCTSAGARKKVCSVCNNAVTETVSALGHSFGAYASNNDATYKADGTKTAKCSLCNQSKTVTDKGSRLTVKKPYSVKIEKSTSAVRLTWDKCIGADGYRVFQKTSSGWKTLGTVTKLTGTIRNLKSGTTYTFAIQPYTNINGAKVWGEYLAVTVSTLPVAPTAKVSSPSKGAVKVSWNNVNGAQKYQLYYKVNNGSYKLYKTYNSAQNLTFKNLKSGAKYTFAVRAYRTVNGCNYYSSYKPVTVTIK